MSSIPERITAAELCRRAGMWRNEHAAQLLAGLSAGDMAVTVGDVTVRKSLGSAAGQHYWWITR